MMNIFKIACMCLLVVMLSSCGDGTSSKLSEADSAVLGGVVGMLGAAEVTNRAKAIASLPGAISVTNCVDIVKLPEVKIPDGFSISAKPISNNEQATCSVTGPKGGSLTFSAMGVLVASSAVKNASSSPQKTSSSRVDDSPPLRCADFHTFVKAKGHDFWEIALIVEDARKNGKCADY